MSKVITFSPRFPSYHPKRGKETYFVHKFWQAIRIPYKRSQFTNPILLKLYDAYEQTDYLHGKSHTIRKGKRWKKGEYFSPRIWSGIPYRSKQISIWQDVLITNVWNIEIANINGETKIFLMPDGLLKRYYKPKELNIDEVAKNDGLTTQDLIDWFAVEEDRPFKGQIICWNPDVNY